MTSFNDFGLAAPLTRALAEEQYTAPTPIQAQTIPLLLAGGDLIGIAQTGTGKTAAFALPILNKLAADRTRPDPKTCRVLVLSPTRELSGQILESFRTYGRHVRISSALAIGGVSMGGQVRSLSGGVDVLVATPGRLLDLVHSNALRLNKVEVFVLDEADRMLDMGFIHDIRKIVSKLPAKRQTLLFSATMPQAIAELAGQMLKDPARVAVTPVASTAERIAQTVVHVDRGAKQGLLADTLRQDSVNRALVFTRTKRGADKVARGLEKSGIAAEAIHGNKSQNNRTRVLDAFRAGKIRTLIATDIAARGIDVDGISHVINFDVPNEPESYVHRIGRTARAGAEGVAITFCAPDETQLLRAIEKLIRAPIPSTRSNAKSTEAVTGDHEQRPRQQHRPQQQHTRSNAHRDDASRNEGKKRRRRPNNNGGRNGERRDQPAAHQGQHAGSGNRRDRSAGGGSHGQIASVAFLQPKPASGQH